MPNAEAAFLKPAFERLGRGRLLYLLAFGSGHRALPNRLRRDGHRVIEVGYTAPRHSHRDRLTGDLLEMNLVPRQFDLVYADRVLERLPAPRPVLDELLRLTRTGGLVAIHTDLDGPSRPAASLGEVAPSAAPMPRSYFRRRTFEKVLENSASTVVEARPHLVLIEVRRRIGVGNALSTAGFLHDKVTERR